MLNVKDRIINNGLLACLIIFLILFSVHFGEAIFLRMDETFIGENFINKVFGIFILFLMLNVLGWKWSDIGFRKDNIAKNILLGLCLGLTAFSIAYFIEILILNGQGEFAGLAIFTTSFSLTGDTVVNSGIGFIVMCILFNIVNVVMEVGTFRGLFTRIVSENHTIRLAIIFQAFLFGIWHIVTPLHNYVDGSLGLGGFIGLSIGYVILAGLMGIKWGFLQEITGSLYAGMADHFFNNCIATNLVHVITVGGIDELMIVRIIIAQLLSFLIVGVAYYRGKNR